MDGKPLLSARARSVADLHGITDKQLSGLRRAVIREQDLAELVRPTEEDGHTTTLGESARRQVIGREIGA